MVAAFQPKTAEAGRVGPGGPSPTPAPAEPKVVAQEWFDAVAAGDVDDAMKVSAVPFLWDGKKMVSERDKLRALYDDVLQRRGSRRLIPERVEVMPADAPHTERYCGKDHAGDGPVVKFWIQKQHVGVCIVRGKVVGFSDS